MRRRELLGRLASAAVLPSAARAQQPVPVIGYLSVGSPETDNIHERLVAFRRGLNEGGYIEGQNVAIEYAWAQGEYDRLPALAADLVRRRVSVIVTQNAPTAAAAKAATSTIPIVFILGSDPVKSGLVARLNRPGGNITGISLLAAELVGKQLELLHELVPAATVLALLVNPSNPVTEPDTINLQDAAASLGLQARVVPVSTAGEIEAAFETLVSLRAKGLLVSSDTLFTSQRAQIIALTAQYALPAIYAWRLFPFAGGLMSYGADLADCYRQLAIYAARILKGERPADLPVQQVTKVELVINLKTAKMHGLTIPLTLAGRADEVIE
jgi:putative tryptophan/tyrosine transport system substrate-binding protein